MPTDQHPHGGRRPHFHRGRRGPDRRGDRCPQPQQAQGQAAGQVQGQGPGESNKADTINVDQIVREIKTRIAQRHGIDLSSSQIQELAARRLEAILDPRTLKPSLLDQLRQNAGAPAAIAPVEPAPAYEFEDHTIFDTHNGLLRALRNLLKPILKLFFNPNPISHALNAQARLNRAILLLLNGDLKDGWRDYAARIDVPGKIPQPAGEQRFTAWTGGSLKRTRLLVRAEQGIGDQILFASVIPELAKRALSDGGSLILECEPRLVPLFARSFPQVSVCPAAIKTIGGRTIADYGWLKSAGGANAAWRSSASPSSCALRQPWRDRAFARAVATRAAITALGSPSGAADSASTPTSGTSTCRSMRSSSGPLIRP